MTVNEARKILGKKSKDLTDNDVEKLLSQIKHISDVVVEIIDKRIANEGTDFLHNDSILR